MSYEPDILVVSPDRIGPSFVAEVKISRRPDVVAAADEQLRRYMFGLDTSVGMTVTPGRVRIFRNTFRSRDPSSIDLVCDATVPGLVPTTERGMDFEGQVQSWLETLRVDSAREALTPDLRASIEEHVLPLLYEGEVRAGTRRWPRTG